MVADLAVLPPEVLSQDDKVNSSTTMTFVTSVPTEAPITAHPCQQILYMEIHHSRVRVWDLIIMIPNIIFFLFLIYRLRTAWIKLRRNSSPIFLTFFGMVMLVALVSLLRCVVAMTVNASVPAGHYADKILWLIVRFFLLAIELSVVIFGLAFGHLDSRTSIQRVLLVTSLIALVYSCIQGVLEFLYPDDRFHVKPGDDNYEIFGHGGMLFWFISSVFFFIVYLVICVLPFTGLRRHFPLPTKQSFYWYTGIMMVMNACQAIGSCLLYAHFIHAMCVVDVTSFLYFSLFAPLVYATFLWRFFASSQPQSILFSYKTHVDVEDEDADDRVNLPPSNSTAINNSTRKNDMMSESYDSTHFDATLSPNPLYGAHYDGNDPMGAVCYDVSSGPSVVYDTDILETDGPLPISTQLTINSEYSASKS